MMISVTSQLLVIGYTALAALYGGVIGIERRRADKPMGIRTHSLVCASSAMIVAIGEVINKETHLGDPTRALHAVITGIGFLGAGAIYGGSKRPSGGLTTAATVFTTAGIGVATGLGAPIVGFAVALITLAILRFVPGKRESQVLDSNSD
jgi:putative Mg2+ transporter-C (MgtC) family protein